MVSVLGIREFFPGCAGPAASGAEAAGPYFFCGEEWGM